jgi:hypothetical protein
LLATRNQHILCAGKTDRLCRREADAAIAAGDKSPATSEVG